MPNPLRLRQAISLENCLMLLHSSGAKDGHDFCCLTCTKSPIKFKCQNEKPRTQPAKISHFWYFELVSGDLALCFFYRPLGFLWRDVYKVHGKTPTDKVLCTECCIKLQLCPHLCRNQWNIYIYVCRT